MLNFKLLLGSTLVIVILLSTLVLLGRNQGDKPKKPQPVASTASQQQKFKVIDTVPKNGEDNVYPGEIEITFETDVPVNSQDSFSLTVEPKPPFYLKQTSSFPTNKITTKVIGKLETNTKYSVSIRDSAGLLAHSWSFTTANQEAKSSSAFMADQEKSYNEKYYPLFDYLPFTSPSFDIDYTNKLTLEVKIKAANVEQVKSEVRSWIVSKGVDLNTHQINYTNNF